MPIRISRAIHLSGMVVSCRKRRAIAIFTVAPFCSRASCSTLHPTRANSLAIKRPAFSLSVSERSRLPWCSPVFPSHFPNNRSRSLPRRRANRCASLPRRLPAGFGVDSPGVVQTRLARVGHLVGFRARPGHNPPATISAAFPARRDRPGSYSMAGLVAENRKLATYPRFKSWGCPDLTDSGLRVKNPRSPHEDTDQ